MGCCASCGQSVCYCATELEGTAIDCTLVASLTNTVDCIRDIATTLGARPYQVLLVWTRWSGGARSQGIEEVIREESILPTPLVADISSVALSMQSIGIAEEGDVRITEISPRFNEDYLSGRGEDGSAIPPDQSFYWEVRRRTSDGLSMRRRFRLSGAPMHEATKFQWKVTLKKIAEDRMRSSDVRG